MKSAPFVIPEHIPQEEHVSYCLNILDKYRAELTPLRRQISDALRWQNHWREKALEWEEKYQQSQEELRQVKQENNKLKQEIEKLTKTNNRYQVSLFDHGNFIKPNKGKRTKGGQPDHADTNREADEDYRHWQRQRLYVKRCGHCGSTLARVERTKQKVLLDIVINPEIIKLILSSERQWCSQCNREVNAKDDRSLPFTEYGINTFMMVILLRFASKTSFTNIGRVMAVFGLPLGKSSVSNLLTQAKEYLRGRYGELIEAVRQGEVMYNDETGWLVRGQPAWMWLMANEEVTVYWASESRGKGNVEELYGDSKARSMHDGYPGYKKTIPPERQMNCWSHVLRFAHQETYGEEDTVGVKLKDELVRIYHLKERVKKDKLQAVLEEELTAVLAVSTREDSAVKIQARVRDQKRGLINALLYTKSGTNNLAERELRGMVILEGISYGSDTFAGMETTAILGSIVQTLKRKEEREFFPTLKEYLQEGRREKYWQYAHVPYYDDS